MKKSTQRCTREIANNRLFVYKIIHDLKHPTQALNDCLTEMIKFNDNNKNMDSKTFMRQIHQHGSTKAMKYLKKFVKKTRSPNSRYSSSKILLSAGTVKSSDEFSINTL